jgi:hypothetical protein
MIEEELVAVGIASKLIYLFVASGAAFPVVLVLARTSLDTMDRIP